MKELQKYIPVDIFGKCETIFYGHHYIADNEVGYFFQGQVNRLGDDFQTLLLVDFAQMGAGVKIEILEAEGGATLQLMGKGLARFFQFFRFGVAQIDQVAVVGQDSIR